MESSRQALSIGGVSVPIWKTNDDVVPFYLNPKMGIGVTRDDFHQCLPNKIHALDVVNTCDGEKFEAG